MDVTADIDLTREVIEIEDTDSEADLERALTKIEREFEAVVKEGFTFDGNFLFSARYSMRKAANPCLDIDGIGTVGLPVSDRDARAIIAVCEPGRRVADSQGHATPGVWEISADKIRFNDLAWNAWIEEKGIEACTALHKEPETPPNCILRKLVIHESGFQQTHFQDEAGPMETKIADLVVVLPSSFEGGQLQLRHGLETRSFNLDQNSGILTSVVAAYVGVCRALSSLTSGYRLSLVYDITRPSRGTGLPPGLPDTRGPAQKLRNILQNWTQATSNAASNTAAPEFLACLLRQTYTTKNGQNFDTGMLSGADGQLISHLTPLLDEFQFRASLAQVTLTERTSASANGNRGYGRPKYDDSESDDSIDVEEFKTDQEDEPERELRVIQVLDLSGLPIDVDLGLETYHLLNGSMTSGEPDEENFEKNDRTSATITKVYHRTVLLLWPKQNSLESKVQVGDICDYVFNALRNSKSTAPTAREKGLVHLLAQSCQRGCRDEKKLQRVVQVLIKSANRWNDAQELVRGLSACRVDERTDLLGVDGFASTYKVFDWDALKDFFEGAMKNDGSNRRRQTLLLRLRELAGEDNDAELAAWCETQQEIVLQFLSKLDAEQIPWLMELSRSRGGGFLRDVIFPQLKKQNLAKEFWLPFLQTLRDAATLIPNCPPDLVEELSVQCFAEMARTVPPFPTNKPKPRYPGDVYNVSDEVHCAPILDVIKLLLENGHAEMCSQIFLQMRDSKSRGAYKATCPPWQYYLGIAPTLIESAATAALSPVFQPFFVDVVDSMISATPRDPNTPEWHTDKSSFLFDRQNLFILRTAARMAGGLSVVKSSLIPANLERHSSSALQELARAITAEFRPRGGVVMADYDDVIDILARAAIKRFDTTSLIARNSHPSTHIFEGPAERMMGLVKFCFEIGAENVCRPLLDRLLASPTGSTIDAHLSNALAPFLSRLHQYLATMRLDFQTEPFRSFAVAVVTDFADKVMCQKHTDFVPSQLRSISCVCRECASLKQFFVGDQKTIEVRDSQQTRQHLEAQLHQTTAKSFGISWETIKYGRPHALKISKPSIMTSRGLRSWNSKNGVKLLTTLGEESTQKALLGSNYEHVKAQITGVTASSRVPNGEKRQAEDAGVDSTAKKLRLF